MDRSDILLVGLGGAGGKLVDKIMDQDGRFQGYFINTSITDIEMLNNSDKDLKNYLCISATNGVGRKRDLGKKIAEKNGYTILDMLTKFTQPVIYFVFALGGGSGSSIASVMLKALKDFKRDGLFDKTVNLIGILPSLNSPEVILENTLDTWVEINAKDEYDNSEKIKVISSMNFICNDNFSDSFETVKEAEEYTNQVYTDLFDSLFDCIDPTDNSFDNGNLGNILTDEGTLYFYDIPTDVSNIHIAMKSAEQKSVLAKMFKSTQNTELSDDGTPKVICGHMGISLMDSYNINFFENNYAARKEVYVGNNDSRNILMVSGCLPPMHYFKSIEMELDSRKRNKSNESYLNFDDIIISRETTKKQESVIPNNVSTTQNRKTAMKKVMKKSLFSR